MTISARPTVPAKQGDPVQTSFSVRVSLDRGTSGRMTLEAAIAAWIFVPGGQAVGSQAPLWYLAIPGATYRGLAYFDRQVPGYAADTFSIARFLASNGIGLVVIDTLGTGASAVEVNGDLITRFVTADANAQVLDQIRERLLVGDLVVGQPPVPEEALFLGGFGHSMGAYQLTQLAALLEDRGTPLDAAIFAGWSHGPFDYARLGLDEATLFTQISFENGHLHTPRAVMRPMFYGPTALPALIEADEADAVTFPKGLFDEALIPGIVAREAGTLSCPVLFVAAAHDLSANPQAEGAAFPCARLFTAYIQPMAAHCNFEGSRSEYWRVLVGWSKMAATLGRDVERTPARTSGTAPTAR